MKRSFNSFVVASLAVLVLGQNALAQYLWTPAQIQGLMDVTPSFHGGAGQLSTINSITPTELGIELDITYEIGQEDDPFGPNYGLGFARVSLSAGLGSPGLDASAFTSSAFNVTTTTDITAQSFLQTDFMENGTTIDDGDGTPDEAFSFQFWEHNNDIAMGGPTVADFDFSMGSEFDGNWNLDNPQQVHGTDAIRQWGVQFGKFSDLVIGQPINATITIESLVPEPTGITLLAIAAVGWLGVRRQRRG